MLVDRYRRDRIIGVGQVVAEKTYRIEYNPECYASQKRPENGFSGFLLQCCPHPDPKYMYKT
jgi:hypothetical protein